MVVIDPDNWLLKDVKRWTDMVTKGNAVGEIAYYHGSKRVQKLWEKMCLKNCNWNLDMVGVPYVLHRDDLEIIAPLWREYSLKIKQTMETANGKSATDFVNE